MVDIRSVETDGAPEAIGSYSQAIVVGDLVFCSGQIPLDPETDVFVSGGIKEQTEQVFNNLEAILEEAGSGLNKVVKVTVFLTNVVDFNEMNEVYERFFNTDPLPARDTVEVNSLPKGAWVEVSCIAALN